MDLDIANLRVLVTAGAAGIGLRIAEAFVREGAKVYVCDVDEAALAALAKSHPQILGTRCDVTDRAALHRTIDEAAGGYGRLDVVFANAGMSGGPGFLNQDRTRNPTRARG